MEQRMGSGRVRAARKPAVEDHRVRVARVRRETMRERILASVLTVYPGEPGEGRAVADDVVNHAGVARSTFYKYFDSLDQAVGELGLKLADETAVSNGVIVETIEDPVLRSITAFLLCLYRARSDPRWGAFVAHMRLPQPDHILTRGVAANFVAGIELGVFSVPSVDAAVNLVIDILIGGVRYVAEQGGNSDYIEALGVMVLKASGVSAHDAERHVAHAMQILQREGHKLPWWRRSHMLSTGRQASSDPVPMARSSRR